MRGRRGGHVGLGKRCSILTSLSLPLASSSRSRHVYPIPECHAESQGYQILVFGLRKALSGRHIVVPVTFVGCQGRLSRRKGLCVKASFVFTLSCLISMILVHRHVCDECHCHPSHHDVKCVCFFVSLPRPLPPHLPHSAAGVSLPRYAHYPLIIVLPSSHPFQLPGCLAATRPKLPPPGNV